MIVQELLKGSAKHSKHVDSRNRVRGRKSYSMVSLKSIHETYQADVPSLHKDSRAFRVLIIVLMIVTFLPVDTLD